MPTLSREIREQLLTYDEEFQKLVQKHSEYEAQLKQLSQASYLDLEDLQQQVTLKKLKLSVKDEMERHIVERLRAAPSREAHRRTAKLRENVGGHGTSVAFFLLSRILMVKDGYKFAGTVVVWSGGVG